MTTSTMKLNMLGFCIGLCLSFCLCSTLPVHLNDKDSLSKQSGDPTIYGKEPYQLQFQEPYQTHTNYYPGGSPSYPGGSSSYPGGSSSYPGSSSSYPVGLSPYPAGPPSYPAGSSPPTGSRYSPTVVSERGPLPPHHSYRHHYHNDRQRTHDRVDYDPFYFSIQNNGVVPSGTRNRRNSKFRDIFMEDPFSNHLLNEDVHFFRRKHHKLSGGPGRHENDVSVESIRFNKDSHQRLPLYASSGSDFSSFPSPHTLGHDSFHSASSSRPTTFDTGHYPRPPYSNYLDMYDAPRHGQVSKLYAPGPGLQRYAREPIDGWSVQVGTQLHVHDDGRERNPAMFYVRHENPANIRRYPHNYEYIRQ